MNKTYKIIKFAIKNMIRILLGIFLQIFFHRSKNIAVMGIKEKSSSFKNSFFKENFMHNTKYLFLYSNTNLNKNFKIIYLCDDTNMLDKFKKTGFKNIYSRKSIKGIFYTLIAKYWLYDYSYLNVNSEFLSFNATLINLWHGIPLKKIGYDIAGYQYTKNSIVDIAYNSLKIQDNFFVINNLYEEEHYKTAFNCTNKQTKMLCSPRLDVLFHDIPYSNLFMEEDFTNIKEMYLKGKKLIIYMPTFRDTGKDISSWLKSEKLRKILQDSNSVMVCKLHPADKNSLDFELGNEFYKMDSNSDVYAILKYTNALITDYSSINFDYLLLDKPIIYFVPDLKEYQEQCRSFYTHYDEFAVGEVAKNEIEIISAISNFSNEIDNYKEQRNILRDKMFKYQDGKNCERVYEWIKSLDK